MKKLMKVVAGAVLGLGLAFVATTTKAGTLENMKTAFNDESNAKARYEAFAAKADTEGYKSVSALFRATAMSEGIHAAKHEAGIKKLGGEAKATLLKVDVKSTKENIEAALKGMDKAATYPAFAKQAEADKNTPAVYSFTGAVAAEVEQVKMLKQAASELESWKASGKEFLVCTVCGYTCFSTPDLKKCPVCSAPRDKFELVK